MNGLKLRRAHAERTTRLRYLEPSPCGKGQQRAPGLARAGPIDASGSSGCPAKGCLDLSCVQGNHQARYRSRQEPRCEPSRAVGDGEMDVAGLAIVIPGKTLSWPACPEGHPGRADTPELAPPDPHGLRERCPQASPLNRAVTGAKRYAAGWANSSAIPGAPPSCRTSPPSARPWPRSASRTTGSTSTRASPAPAAPGPAWTRPSRRPVRRHPRGAQARPARPLRPGRPPHRRLPRRPRYQALPRRHHLRPR